MSKELRDRLLTSKDDIANAERRLEMMKNRRRMAIAIAYKAGHTYEAIAAVTGISFKQVGRIVKESQRIMPGFWE